MSAEASYPSSPNAPPPPPRQGDRWQQVVKRQAASDKMRELPPSLLEHGVWYGVLPCVQGLGEEREREASSRRDDASVGRSIGQPR